MYVCTVAICNRYMLANIKFDVFSQSAWTRGKYEVEKRLLLKVYTVHSQLPVITNDVLIITPVCHCLFVGLDYYYVRVGEPIMSKQL